MKCPICGSVMIDTDPECPRCARSAGRGVSVRRARAERVITFLLVLALVSGLIGLVAVVGHRHFTAATTAQTLPKKQAAPPAATGTEADDAPAAKRDAQGDQASDD
ncbi:MAG: hypothetical protein JO250_14625 [Armatimonadetes bacterium]|nr:hypothetical protein [Armatimonadota bacterium]